MSCREFALSPGTRLLVVLVPILVGVIPSSPHSRSWGYAPGGMVGVALFMGGETTPSRGIDQNAGEACRLPGKYLKEELVRAGPLQRLLLGYTQTLITRMAQTAVCNRHHSVEQQLCR